MWGVAKALVKNSDKKANWEVTTPHTHDGESIHEDDKLKKKGLPSTPEKPTSPSVVPIDRKMIIIDDEELQKLAIKDQDLNKDRDGEPLRFSIRKSLTESKHEPTKHKAVKPIVVRKVKPGPEVKKSPMRQIVVARAAPPNAKLKQVEQTTPSGPRYTKEGEIIPYSILGSVHNFVGEAIRHHDMKEDCPAVAGIPVQAGSLEVKKYERSSSLSKNYIPTAMNQENALLNWRRKMADRKKQQGHISNLLSKPHENLVMNQAETYREVQEKRKVVDRAIPAIDYGKGYRTGSEFWMQYETFGDELTGIKMTLTKTEKGNPVVFEHVGKPLTIQHEMSESKQDRNRFTDHRRTWMSSKYLKQRTRQLQPIMNELDAYTPDISNLEVIGNEGFHQHTEFDNFTIKTFKDETNEQVFIVYLVSFVGRVKEDVSDPLSKYPDVLNTPFVGPSIVFNGNHAQWTGSSTENKDSVGAMTRVTFESVAGSRTSSHLQVENNGTTAIYYEWRKLTQVPSFDALVVDHIQRFYFNTGEGVILPGDTIKVPFVFKSPNAGIFTETWRFLTRPAVMGGADLQVVLRGIAIQDDLCTVGERIRIEQDLDKKSALSVVTSIIDNVVRGIQSAERPCSPLDAYTTEKEIFLSKNSGRYYDHETVTQLKNIYLQLFQDQNLDGKEWDLSLDELQSCVSAVPDEAARDALLHGLNTIVGRLSFSPSSTSQHLKYTIGYMLWKDTLDKFSGCSMMVRSIMGLPEVVMTESVSEPELSGQVTGPPPKPDPKGSSPSSNNSQPSSIPSTPLPKPDEKKGKGKKAAMKDVKEEKGKKGKNTSKESKEKDRPKSKDPKAKGGKGQVASPTKEPQAERDDSKTPSSVRPTSTPTTDTLDPAMRRKYSEKLYGQVYELLIEMVENMSIAFEDIEAL